MGATTHRSLKSITESKYSFSHPKSRLPIQISCWKFIQEQLQSNVQCVGESLRWPFKFYSDQGYILMVIENKSISQRQHFGIFDSRSKQGLARLGQVKVTLNILQILYSFYNGEIQEYFSQKILTQNESKYINEKLSSKIYVYTGENLSSKSKLKLMSYAIQIQRYMSRGGLCSISKLYHQYEQLFDLNKQIKLFSQSQNKVKQQNYYVQLITLLSDQFKLQQAQQVKNASNKTMLQTIHNRLIKFELLNNILFKQFNLIPMPLTQLFCQQKNKYIVYDSSNWHNRKNLIVKNDEIKKEAIVVTKREQLIEKKSQKVNLNDSSPFQCQITQINYKQKKKQTDNGYLNDDSNLIDQLSVLNEKKVSQFVKVVCQEQDYLVLSDYNSIKDYKKCVQLNVQLVINLAPHVCYNYFLNDLKYLYYYITPLPTKTPSDNIIFQYNLQSIIFQITHTIISTTSQNKSNDSFNNRVVIHSSAGLFSDQNCAIAIGYLIVRYLYTFQKAFAILSKVFKAYKNENVQLLLHKIYVDQLLTLQGRVLMTSSPNYGVSINSTYWRAYQLSNNHFSPCQTLIYRFIGQIHHVNQLTSLPNHSHHCFIVLSHQLIPIFSQIIDKWQKDSTIKPPQGVTGIKVLLGKQFSFRQQYIATCKRVVPMIIKYEYINRAKHEKSFHNQFLFKFIEGIVAVNLQIQFIQKSFRKALPFTPLYTGFEEQNPAKSIEKIPQPYNSKQKLIFKYPYLRPSWQSLKDDEYYFIVHVTKAGASIQIVKGKNWSGYQVDKQTFFASIVDLYLANIQQQKIWVSHQGEQSIFGDEIAP